MGIYARVPYWWMKFEADPVTGVIPRAPMSTKIYVDGGSPVQSKQNRADAEHMFQKACIDIRAGVLAPSVKTKPPITVRDWAAKWLATYAIAHKGYEHEASVVKIIVADLGDVCLHELTATRIAQWRAEKCKTVKKRTADRYIDVLRPMLSKAIDYIDENPISGRDRMGNQKWTALDWDETTKRWFSREEFARFVEAVESQPMIVDTPRAEGLAFTYAAIETLLRRGSLLDLTWALYRPSSPKYAFRHFLPINAKVGINYSPVSSNLWAYLDQLPRKTPRDRVFASHFRTDDPKRADGSADSHCSRWFAAVCALAHLPCGKISETEQGLTFHSFRHSGASWLIAEGRSVKEVMELGGWKSAQLFMDTYCHTTAADVAQMVEEMFTGRNKVVSITRKKRARG